MIKEIGSAALNPANAPNPSVDQPVPFNIFFHMAITFNTHVLKQKMGERLLSNTHQNNSSQKKYSLQIFSV